MMPLKRSCKEVATLLITAEDRTLPLAERLALRLHMAVCEACPRFQHQVLTMRNSMKMWRSYTESDDFVASDAPADRILRKK